MGNFAETITTSASDAIVDHTLDPQNAAEHKVFIRGVGTGVEVVSFEHAGGQEEGANLCIVNDTPHDITLKHNDTRGTAGHRIISSTGADITLAAGKPLWGVLVEVSTDHPNGWRFEAP